MKKTHCPMIWKGGKCARKMKTCKSCGVVNCGVNSCPIRYFLRPYDKCRRCGTKWASQNAKAGKLFARKGSKMLTDRASKFRSKIENPSRFLETCDGGDPGNPQNQSIWLLGIEPGWSLADQASEKEEDEASADRYQLYPVDLQLGWPFNRNAFKLLHALEGGQPEGFRDFAQRTQPFVRGSSGYFKANLFPVPFNKVNDWDSVASDETGFATKEEYRSWVRESRIPVLNDWIKRSRPKLVIGSGLTCGKDFLRAVGATDGGKLHQFEINGYQKKVITSVSGTVPVAVIPHLSGGPSSLNSNEAIRQAAALIRKEFQF